MDSDSKKKNFYVWCFEASLFFDSFQILSAFKNSSFQTFYEKNCQKIKLLDFITVLH